MIKLKLERTRIINTGNYENEQITIGIEVDDINGTHEKHQAWEIMELFVQEKLNEISETYGWKGSVKQDKEPPLKVPTKEFKSHDQLKKNKPTAKTKPEFKKETHNHRVVCPACDQEMEPKTAKSGNIYYTCDSHYGFLEQIQKGQVRNRSVT